LPSRIVRPPERRCAASFYARAGRKGQGSDAQQPSARLNGHKKPWPGFHPAEARRLCDLLQPVLF